MTARQIDMLIIAAVISTVVSVFVARWLDDRDHGRG
jgi:hypothetical protein